MKKPQVTLELVTRDTQTPLVNLLELYMHDMSERFPLRMGDDGRFGYAWLPTYWAEPDLRFPYLIRTEDGLGGFVLVTTGSPESADPTVLDVAEFFVIRRLRRTGVGSAAITKLWDERKGNWLVRVSRGNSAGQAFWPRIVDEYSGGKFRQREEPGRHFPWDIYELASRSV